MALTRRDLRNARELRQLVDIIRDLKDDMKRAEPKPPTRLPRIGLDVDPAWVKKNSREAAKKIEILSDALKLAITYADAAKQPHKRYKTARQMLIEALCGAR